MTLSSKKIKIFQSSYVKEAVTKFKSTGKQLITQNEETLKTSELLLLQINSGENEILFI